MQRNFQRPYRGGRKVQRKNNHFERLKKKLKPHMLPVGLLVFVILFFVLVAGQIKRTYKVYSQVGDLESELAQIEQSNKDLEAQIKTFENPEVIDKEARERLNLKKQGENVVIIIPNDERGEIEQQLQDLESTRESFWKKIKRWFAL